MTAKTRCCPFYVLANPICGGAAFSTIATVVSIVATVASTALGAYQSYQQGQQNQALAKYNARVAENQALQARYAAQVKEEQHRARILRLAGTARAGVGASGIEESGSPLLVMADSLEQAELDAQRIRYGGEVSAQGLESEARLQRFMGRQAASAGLFNAGGTLLSGAGRVASYLPRFGSTGSSSYRPIDETGGAGLYYP